MPDAPTQAYRPARDLVLLGVVGFLAGLGTVLAIVSRFAPAVMLVFLVVAVLLVIWLMYFRARGAGGPPG